MRRFVFYIILFSAMVLATLAGGEWLVRRIPNPYSIKDRYIAARGEEIKSAVLGSSHAYYGIIPDSLDETSVSLANVSQNFEYDFRVLGRYLSHVPGLRRIYVPVSYFSFFDPPFEKGDEWFYEIYYRMYMDIGKYPRFSRYGFEISNFPVYSGKIKSLILGSNLKGSSPSGFGLDYSYESRSPHWEQSASVSARRHTAPDLRYMDYNIMWLDSLLMLARRNNIEVIMLSTPVSRAYRRCLDRKQLAVMRHIVDSVSDNNGVRYYDFSSVPGFGDDDFYDADHLSDRGARRFTRLLRDTLGR